MTFYVCRQNNGYVYEYCCIRFAEKKLGGGELFTAPRRFNFIFSL